MLKRMMTAIQNSEKFLLKRLLVCCVAIALQLCLVACGGGIYHRVQPGQTLYRISRTYGVAEARIVRANRIKDPTQIRIGTRLYIPGADRVRYVATVKPKPPDTPSFSKIKPKLGPEKKYPKKTAKVTPAKKKVVTKKSSKSKKTTATEIKRLSWPIRGKTVRPCSSKANAGGGKGIEIAVRAGSQVKAAEAGKVIYSGDGVKGYGYLIILQHENEFFSVYGFNQRNFVRLGDFVSRGEKIALSGVPPSGGSPRLHFEVRKGKQAVNPILYLP